MASTNTSSGTGFFGLLTILFVALKLTGYINWPWWMVVAPVWAPLAIGIVVLLGLWSWLAWGDRRTG